MTNSRIIRIQGPELFAPNVLAILDRDANILRINKKLFDTLTDGEKRKVYFTERERIYRDPPMEEFDDERTELARTA